MKYADDQTHQRSEERSNPCIAKTSSLNKGYDRFVGRGLAQHLEILLNSVPQLPIANSAKIPAPPTRLPRRMFSLLINNSEVRGT